ncbi:MAG: protein phosphatase 2C domain-containing protein [Hyphomicrobiaceae bacterium]
MMQLEMATAEYIGARAQQQDLAAAIALKSGALLVLADGLGGHESGAEASRIVVETFREAAAQGLFDDPESRRQALRDTIERANGRIGEGVDPAHGHRGMGVSAVAAVISRVN